MLKDERKKFDTDDRDRREKNAMRGAEIISLRIEEDRAM